MPFNKDPLSKKAKIAAAAILAALILATIRAPKDPVIHTPPPEERAQTAVNPENQSSPLAGEGTSTSTLDVVPTTPPTNRYHMQRPKVFENTVAAKKYLADLTGNDRDFTILEAIIQCESGWGHFWTETKHGRVAGEVKVSLGNVGYGQLNWPTWEAWMQKNHNLDIYAEDQNLQATVSIYKRSGIGPWKPYSGHCWLPILAAKGIYL